MIVVDSSALFAILLNEDEADRCEAAIDGADELLMSAGTLTEVLVVAAHKRVSARTRMFLNTLELEVVPLTRERALEAGAAFEQWGRSIHPAALNYGDSFSYALAKEYDCPLLFVGKDFSKTDANSALQPRD